VVAFAPEPYCLHTPRNRTGMSGAGLTKI